MLHGLQTHCLASAESSFCCLLSVLDALQLLAQLNSSSYCVRGPGVFRIEHHPGMHSLSRIPCLAEGQPGSLRRATFIFGEHHHATRKKRKANRWGHCNTLDASSNFDKRYAMRKRMSGVHALPAASRASRTKFLTRLACGGKVGVAIRRLVAKKQNITWPRKRLQRARCNASATRSAGKAGCSFSLTGAAARLAAMARPATSASSPEGRSATHEHFQA